jgi:hypothetical protein
MSRKIWQPFMIRIFNILINIVIDTTISQLNTECTYNIVTHNNSYTYVVELFLKTLHWRDSNSGLPFSGCSATPSGLACVQQFDILMALKIYCFLYVGDTGENSEQKRSIFGKCALAFAFALKREFFSLS